MSGMSGLGGISTPAETPTPQNIRITKDEINFSGGLGSGGFSANKNVVVNNSYSGNNQGTAATTVQSYPNQNIRGS